MFNPDMMILAIEKNREGDVEKEVRELAGDPDSVSANVRQKKRMQWWFGIEVSISLYY
jgi:hypothetical protein